jgi:predicted nuclease of predicted toxin-antitoxin system
MKLHFDQNLSHWLPVQLSTDYPGSLHVRDLGMANASDPIIWTYAAANDFVIVSKDTDFQQRAMLYGHPPKVIWLRLGNCSTAAVANLLSSRLNDIAAFEADTTASLMVIA